MKSIQSMLRSKHLLMLQNFPLPIWRGLVFLTSGAPLLSYLLLMCYICNACTRNNDTETVVPPLSESIVLEVTIPNSQQILSYAGGAFDDSYIESADVFVFSNNLFAYHTTARDINNGPAKSVKVKLNSHPSPVFIMLIVNARTEIAAALTDNDFTGKTKDEVMAAVTFNSSGKWLVSTGSWKPLPMWGTSTGTITSGNTAIPITLLRSVAKIDIGINFEDNSDVAHGLGNQFVLTSVTLHNAPTKLAIAPLSTNLAGTVVTAPTVPNGVGLNIPLEYTVSDGKSCVNQIYLGESAVATLPDKKVCLIIGGKWSDTNTEGSTTTYYRVDFVKNTLTDGLITAQQYLPILRNHQYKVNIKNVARAGHSTPALAFSALGVNTNLTVELTESDSRITDIVSNQQYYLGVGRVVNLTSHAHPDIYIYIETNKPSGWTISALPSWISKTGDHTKGIKIKIDKNDTNYERIGEIVVTAGLLQRTIKVVQQGKID